MNWGFLLIILFIFGLAGTGLYFYYYYEKPIQDKETQYTELSIAAFNPKTNENMKVNYNIMMGSKTNFYRNGTTSKSGFIREKVPTNVTYFIYNFKGNNLDTKTYYTNFNKVDGFNQGPHRVILKMLNPGNLSIIQDREFSENKNISLFIATDSTYKNIHICATWSTHILTVKFPLKFEEINKFDKYKDYIRCFNTQTNLENPRDYFKFDVNYETFGILDENDYIKLAFIDYDEILKENVGEDYIYTIKKDE